MTAFPGLYNYWIAIVLMMIATTSLGLALVVRIQEAYGTIEEEEIYGLGEKVP